jgi:hypothetical protein
VAELQRGEAPAESLSLASFVRRDESSIWDFLTNEFELIAQPGETVPHKITVAATLAGGRTVQASATLNVKGL